MLIIAAENWSHASIQRIKTCTITCTSLDFLLSILIRKLLCGPPEGIEVRGGERLAALAEGARPAEGPLRGGGAARGGGFSLGWKLFSTSKMNVIFGRDFANFWRARYRLYQNESLQENMRLTYFLANMSPSSHAFQCSYIIIFHFSTSFSTRIRHSRKYSIFFSFSSIFPRDDPASTKYFKIFQIRNTNIEILLNFIIITIR